MKVLVLGATGLLGNAVFRSLQAAAISVSATVRSEAKSRLFSRQAAENLIVVEDLEKTGALYRLFDRVKPDVVINCVSVGRPPPADPMRSIQIYAALPQRISHVCQLSGARFIQISSDGVFSGARGGYTETDIPDATDVYGTAKLLGEVAGLHAINLRTSMIGHELESGTGLLEWFLKQQTQCRCHTRAVFSGFPTIVLAEVLRDIVIPRPELHGVYHLASHPISKYDLLKLVAARYGKTITLIPDDEINIDRSLVAERFARATGYTSPDWPALIDKMYSDRFGSARS
jgi:dTDP-4-dehydrorhamnose reductase